MYNIVATKRQHRTSCHDGLVCVFQVTNNIGDNSTQTQITIQIILISHVNITHNYGMLI